MLKYVNTDFQISDFKTGTLIIVASDSYIEATFNNLKAETTVCI